MQQFDMMTMRWENSNQQHQLTEENISNHTSEYQKASSTLSLNPNPKKRKRPGNPDPGAEVIALSPNSLMTTHNQRRFICGICNRGFKRDMNLQLHRTTHNLPYKLQKTSKDLRKKVFVCPEVSCVYHDASRALGDITGIKRHFSRKHGEKKWKCQRCSKKYAVKTDLNTHSRNCGTKEYLCECGALFFRRDSFNNHRAFCDALSDENSRAITNPLTVYHPLLFSQPNYDPTLLGFQTYSTRMLTEPSCMMTTGNGLQGLSLTTMDYQQPEFNIWPDVQQLHYHACPHMSATDQLLQKGAQMGSTVSKPQNTQMATHSTEDIAGFGLELYTHQEMDYMHNPSPLPLDMTTTNVSLATHYDVCFNKVFMGMVGTDRDEHQVGSTANQEGGTDGITRDFLGPFLHRDLFSLNSEPWYG